MERKKHRAPHANHVTKGPKPEHGKSQFWLEDVARMVLQKRAPPLTESERNADNARPRPKITLPRVHFLERPYPEWWNDKETKK
jgi:hypothetical protein